MQDVRSGRGREHGAAAVELALVLPIIMVLVFGIVQFGFYYNATIELSGAAREGARSMAIDKTTATAQTVAKAAAANSCQVASDPCTVAVSTATNTCPAGTDVTVTVSRSDYTIDIPFVPKTTVGIQGKAVMRCGG